ncbi:MAG: haloalkane dehalogenase, partial [Polyangiaceae bacterium]
MKILRTPDDRFRNLPGYEFAPHYFDLKTAELRSGVQDEGLRLHYVDEGPSAGTPILMLHGEPSWSFLYRKMIPVFVKAGFRAVAPDLVGFGKSDKPSEPDDYSYAKHVAWITQWLEAINLRHATLVCQDWGSLIGLRVAMENQDRFDRIVVANGFLPTARQSVPFAFHAWRAFAAYSPLFPIG